MREQTSKRRIDADHAAKRNERKVTEQLKPPIELQSRLVALSQKASEFAFEPNSRILVALAAEAAAVSLYSAAFLDGDDQEAKTNRLAAKVVSIGVKQLDDEAYALVGCDDGVINIIDLKTSAFAKRIALGGGTVFGIEASTNPPDSIVYYPLRQASVNGLARFGWMNLDTESEQGYYPEHSISTAPAVAPVGSLYVVDTE